MTTADRAKRPSRAPAEVPDEGRFMIRGIKVITRAKPNWNRLVFPSAVKSRFDYDCETVNSVHQTGYLR